MDFSIKPAYLFILATMALVSCSQDDAPGPAAGGNNQVLFRTTLPELSTRTNIVTEENLPYFNVSAFDLTDNDLLQGTSMVPLFANQKINITGNDNAYKSPYCCWPDPGKERHVVSFFGFYPGLDEIEGADLVNASTLGNLSYKLTGFRVAENIANQVDFITAYSTGTMADNLFSGVNLPFTHQLSRIEIKAYGTHKSCDIEIAGVRIGGTGVANTFEFKPSERGGEWVAAPERGIVEYIFDKDDKIVTCGKNNPVSAANAASIIGAKHKDGHEKCALLLPSDYDPWDYAQDNRNGKNQMYISVLLRITDATPTAGINPKDKQRYPYKDLSQGADSYSIPVEYFAINKETDKVVSRLYKKDGEYFTDPGCKSGYSPKQDEEIREFGWAAVPVQGSWLPGYKYTYTLDYTLGVGLHDPSVSTASPKAGDPVISDKVGVTYSITEWKPGGGSEFIVPGS